MNQRLGLFASQAVKRLVRANPSRKLYTDTIYPYPYKYFNEYQHPSVQIYRENWDSLPKIERDVEVNKWMMRLFWTYFFWSLFHDPAAIYGHCTFPEPSLWTDEELGIPPLEAGPYKEWLEKNLAVDEK